MKHQSADPEAKSFEGDFYALAHGEHVMREKKRIRTLELIRDTLQIFKVN